MPLELGRWQGRARCGARSSRAGARLGAAPALFAFAFVFALGVPASASAGSPAPDPPANSRPGPMPVVCRADPRAVACTNAMVYYLDLARRRIGLGPYLLPAAFPSLPADQQVFILTNLDRGAYGLAPVGGLTAELGVDAYAGVLDDTDPTWSAGSYYTSLWAGSFDSFLVAYYSWLYADGPGSGNLDCGPQNASGCWGHRHGALWLFPAGPLAMGAADGPDRSGQAGYAMLLASGATTAYQPVYTLTWGQALAAGAGANRYDPGLPQIPVALGLRITGYGQISGAARCAAPSCAATATVGIPFSLQATPAPGWVFAGWTGACRGTAACAATPTGALSVTAVFAPLQVKIAAFVLHRSSRSLTVRVAGPPGATFSCSLVRRSSRRHAFPNARYIPCASARTYRHLKRGGYRFSARASGAGSASRSFRIT